jgi:hypothetical protein
MAIPIAMTAATQPSIENIVLGQIPWIPKVTLHNPFLAAANGDDFLKPFPDAEDGKMENSSNANIQGVPPACRSLAFRQRVARASTIRGIPRNAPRGTAPSDNGLESSLQSDEC